MEDKHSDIEKILAEREKIDHLLKSKFSKKISVMFTDIKGSTSVYESRGDIDGRAMVHRHNEIVLPILKQHNGELLKTIGDATMTVFDEPVNALNAAVAIQRTLKDFNVQRSPNDQIHIRIGINYGTVIVDKGDVFGDVVNVASRVEGLAHADDIYVTEDMYQVSKNNDEIIFRYVDTTQVKGKKDALKVYRVLWHEEALFLGKTRGPVHKKPGLFVLEVLRYGQKLKVSGFERKEDERPVTGYKEIKFNETKIRNYTKGIIDLLNRANKRGKIGSDLLVKLKDYGKLLCDELIPPVIKEQLLKTNEKNLMISIDDELVYIPWEMLYDGKNFFCQRFCMGRSVKTQQQVSVVSRALARPLKMQLLVDPNGDLKAAYEEGVEIKNEIGPLDDWINVSFKSTDIRTDYVKAKIRNFDIVHYAGHAEHDAQLPERSGWILSDGKMSAEDIINLKGAMPMPALVFSNACQSGQTDEWKIEEDCENRIYGLANAFLLTGVQHYIGTFWEIPDQAGSYFAIHFYKSILRGDSIGEAVRTARLELINRYGEDTIVWASYMLYGDPATAYVHPLMGEKKEEPEKKAVMEELVATELRHREQVIHLDQDKKRSKNMIYAGIAFLIVAAISLLLIQKGMTPGGREQTVASLPSKEMPAAIDAERQKRIDTLVASLAEDYRKGIIRQKQTDQSQQTLMPLTMVLMDVKSTGSVSGETVEKLKGLLPLTLEQEHRIRFVERELLDKLLAELRLSATDLADPSTALKIGRLLSARIIITGSIIADKNAGTVILRFIDTETSEIRKVISAESSSGEIDRKVIDEIGGKIIEWFRNDFPSQGKEMKG